MNTTVKRRGGDHDDVDDANDITNGDADCHDRVVQLREWGSDITHVLPGSSFQHGTVEAALTCAIRIDDPSGESAGLEARLIRDRGRWRLYGVGRTDGARRTDIMLEPGAEVGIGNCTLVAESHRCIAQRRFLCRLLGWTDTQSGAVDLALRSIRRLAETRRLGAVWRR